MTGALDSLMAWRMVSSDTCEMSTMTKRRESGRTTSVHGAAHGYSLPRRFISPMRASPSFDSPFPGCTAVIGPPLPAEDAKAEAVSAG
jgi:hypothetical protein